MFVLKLWEVCSNAVQSAIQMWRDVVKRGKLSNNATWGIAPQEIKKQDINYHRNYKDTGSKKTEEAETSK